MIIFSAFDDCWHQLAMAMNRIAELEKELEELHLRRHEDTLKLLESSLPGPGCPAAPPAPSDGPGHA